MDPSTKQIIEVVAIVCSILGTGGFLAALVLIGRWVGRIEKSAEKVHELEESLDRIPSIEQRQEFAEEKLSRLEDRHDSTRVHAIRGEALSGHDFKEDD